MKMYTPNKSSPKHQQQNTSIKNPISNINFYKGSHRKCEQKSDIMLNQKLAGIQGPSVLFNSKTTYHRTDRKNPPKLNFNNTEKSWTINCLPHKKSNIPFNNQIP